jgi:hypothetical protein
VNEIIGDHQCGFRRNRSTTDQIFYIRQILQKLLSDKFPIQNGLKHEAVLLSLLFNSALEYAIRKVQED